MSGAGASSGASADGSREESPLLSSLIDSNGDARFDLSTGSGGSAHGTDQVSKRGSVVESVAPASRFLWVLVLFASVGGLLFGYDTGVVSGALLVISAEFHLNDVQKEAVVSSTIAGAVLGAAFAGSAADRVGRRPTILVASVIFTAGAGVMAGATGFEVLVAGRAIVGVAIGMAAMVVPVYIAEASPPEHRGMLVTANNLATTGGQFLSSVVDGAFARTPGGWRWMLGLSAVPAVIQFVGFLFLPESPRWLVGAGRYREACAALKRISGGAALDDTEDSGQEFDAATAGDGSPVMLHETEGYSLGVRRQVQAVHDSLLSSQSESSISLWAALKDPPVRRALILGCGFQALQQLAAINTVMYYSGTILTMAGVRDRTLAIWLVAAVAFANFAGTIVGMSLVDRVGRRKLTLGSLAGVVLCLGLLSGSFFWQQTASPVVSPLNSTYGKSVVDAWDTSSCASYDHCFLCVADPGCGFCPASPGTPAYCLPGNATAPGRDVQSPELTCGGGNGGWDVTVCPGASKTAWLALSGLILYLLFFAPGMGPMPWTVNSEIYPIYARSVCVSAATTTNWVSNFAVSATFISLSRAMTPAGTFAMYGGISAVGLLWLWSVMPETKGKSLEEVVALFGGSHAGGDRRSSSASHVGPGQL